MVVSGDCRDGENRIGLENGNLEGWKSLGTMSVVVEGALRALFHPVGNHTAEFLPHLDHFARAGLGPCPTIDDGTVESSDGQRARVRKETKPPYWNHLRTEAAAYGSHCL